MSKFFDADKVVSDLQDFEFSQIIFSANKVRIFGQCSVKTNKVTYVVEVMYDEKALMTFDSLDEAARYACEMMR